MTLFNKCTFEKFGYRDYSQLTETSKEIMNHRVNMINSKYSKNYDSKNAHEIEHDGCQNWFYAGFHDPDDDDSDKK